MNLGMRPSFFIIGALFPSTDGVGEPVHANPIIDANTAPFLGDPLAVDDEYNNAVKEAVEDILISQFRTRRKPFLFTRTMARLTGLRERLDGGQGVLTTDSALESAAILTDLVGAIEEMETKLSLMIPRSDFNDQILNLHNIINRMPEGDSKHTANLVIESIIEKSHRLNSLLNSQNHPVAVEEFIKSSLQYVETVGLVTGEYTDEALLVRKILDRLQPSNLNVISDFRNALSCAKAFRRFREHLEKHIVINIDEGADVDIEDSKTFARERVGEFPTCSSTAKNTMEEYISYIPEFVTKLETRHRVLGFAILN
jgi:hypothetical protein